MARLQTSFILGYHGCRKSVADKILKDNHFVPSDHNYDWLGPGVYFWEENPQRALSFAEEATTRDKAGGASLAVVGAAIDLGNCLDLTSAEGIKIVFNAYQSLLETSEINGDNLPESNKNKGLNKLDCAVIRRVHDIIEEKGYEPFDSIRGIFQEGANFIQVRLLWKKHIYKLPSETPKQSRAYSACRKMISASRQTC